ncbi:MAG: hypothetical protein ACP5IL_17120, partial [Syntrophobacteraceae bacterium]
MHGRPLSPHFRHVQDRMLDFRENLQEWIFPYYKDFKASESWNCLCPQCYGQCVEASQKVQAGVENWLGGTKSEYLKGHRT